MIIIFVVSSFVNAKISFLHIAYYLFFRYNLIMFWKIILD